ncbi:hypothetical protein MAR_009545 [Mya arenaria]|uniref:Uncharacterized protein n=1 Tax=Mya arenaria TaxID=6604 RepID=A0ABY7E214_MYAAR|nr:hypothetical protein MAR_009545 [Mya arenaria]
MYKRCDCSDGYIRTDKGDCVKDSDSAKIDPLAVIAIVFCSIVLFAVLLVVKYWHGHRKGNAVGSEQDLGDVIRS